MICCIFNSKDDASFTIQTLETFQNHTISYNHNDLKKKWRIQKEKIGLFPILGCIPSATELSGRPRQLLSSLQLLAVHFLLSQAQSKYELATSPLQDAGTWTLFPMFRTLKFLVSSSSRSQKFSEAIHLCYVSHWNKILEQKQLMDGKVSFSLQCEGTVYHDRDDTVAGAWGSWSHLINSQEGRGWMLSRLPPFYSV